MHLIHSARPLSIDASVVSIGNFDGVHRGHIMLIKEVVRRAHERKAASLIITFDPHTRSVVTPGKPQPILTDPEEKAMLIEKFGVDYLVVLKFDQEMMHMPAEAFIDHILLHQLRAAEWVMGEGHSFGKNKQGSAASLRQAAAINHIRIFAAKLAFKDATVISSTEIRQHIIRGQMADALSLMGHSYPIITERIRGIHKATELGFPTVNFKKPQEPKTLPPPGVYAAKLEFRGNSYIGALYWGDCPTFEGREFHFEFHLLEKADVLPQPGEKACLWVHDFVRRDKAFKDEPALAHQIGNDIQIIQRFFSQE
jgi:riboflavin kinase/FMN adenylyltransferase